jgi:hypothetical protein
VRQANFLFYNHIYIHIKKEVGLLHPVLQDHLFSGLALNTEPPDYEFEKEYGFNDSVASCNGRLHNLCPWSEAVNYNLRPQSSETDLIFRFRQMSGNSWKRCSKYWIFYDWPVLLKLVRSISARRQGAAKNPVFFFLQT